ncbi:MAG: UDP-N-acetylmuramoyl-tripeptide--D-alanyl-D-alanine ligase [Phycisphaerales bacterium]|nr:UDP-N-acetylmuramoyl-tripeptide--D-alanyl-D-alanine ligase [Phycisphaerales bacterium]
MKFWTTDKVRVAAGGSWIARAPQGEIELNGLSTDTRSIRPGQAFLALRGDRHDGHAYLRDAVNAGAALLIIDRPEVVPPGVGGSGGTGAGSGVFSRPVAIIKVADTGRALLKMAGVYRKTLSRTRVIAVGGSNGKTTTTRLIDTLLATKLRGTASQKSFNNAVGVPLTILSASGSDQYLICEVGTNAPGEIGMLAEVIEPEVAVITSIGREHLEGLSTLEGVAREEAQILTYLRPGGLAVVTADAPQLAEHLRCVPNVVTFGRSDKADLRLTGVEHVTSADGRVSLRFTVNDRQTCTLPMIGEHNALNALAALAVARRLGISEGVIGDALAAATAPAMRLERVNICGIEVINDAYNANPESTIAAVRTLASLGANAKRRIAVLGDMLELGAAAPDAHREVAQAVLDAGNIDKVVIVGHLGLYTAERLARDWAYGRYVLESDLDAGQAKNVAALFEPGDLVLLKGSRRMRLERVLEALRERVGTTAGCAGTIRPAVA